MTQSQEGTLQQSVRQQGCAASEDEVLREGGLKGGGMSVKKELLPKIQRVTQAADKDERLTIQKPSEPGVGEVDTTMC